MKTTEEIEQLAKKEYNYLTEYEQMHNQKIVVIDAYIDGYTQCQEDMANLIKKAIEYGYELRNNNKPINSGIDWVKEFNSLNK